jgi:hypothetical protein
MLVVGMVAVATISAAGVSVVNTHQLKKKAELDELEERDAEVDAESSDSTADPEAPDNE